MFSNNLLNFFLNTIIFFIKISHVSLESSQSQFSYLKVGEGSWGEDELVESSEEGSHEGVGLGNINLSGVVDIELSPGLWEVFGHVVLHLGLGNLLGDKEDFTGSFLSSILVKDLSSGGLSSSIGDWDGVMVEDVVHNIILISTVVSGGWGISSGWGGLLGNGDGFNGGSNESC